MRRSLCFGFCMTALLVLLSSSVKSEEDDEVPREAFVESMNALKRAFLENWVSEVQSSQSVLVFPAAVLQEFLLEHVLRLPEDSPSRAKLVKVMPFDKGLPFSLDLSNITVAPLQDLDIQTFHYNTPPEMNLTMTDPIYFSYKAFMGWSGIRLEAIAAVDDETTAEPFNPFLTVASVRINEIQSQGFGWIDPIHFMVSDTQKMTVMALSNVASYDYAEFTYPQLSHCTAGALRLQINNESSIIFVIARNVSDAQCNSSQNLLKILEDINLETISFTPKYLFVSLPILRVSTIVAPARKLIQLGLLAPKLNRHQGSSIFADHYESASLVFDLEVPRGGPVPMIHPDTPSFHADRPFLVTVLQKENPVPVLAGLIQNPEAGFECCSSAAAAPEPIRVAISVQNKGKGNRRPTGQGQRRRQRRTTTQSISTTTDVDRSITVGQTNNESD